MLRFSRPFSCRFQPQSGWFWPFQLGGDAPISPVKGNLRFEKGIKNIITDLKTKTVTIEYDADKTNVQNIIKAFKKIKYEAKEVKKEAAKEQKSEKK